MHTNLDNNYRNIRSKILSYFLQKLQFSLSYIFRHTLYILHMGLT